MCIDQIYETLAHEFDQYTITGNQLLSIVKNDKDLAVFYTNFESLLSGREKNKVKHEIVSCVFIIKILATLKMVAIKSEGKFNEHQKEIIAQLNPGRIIKMIEPSFNAIAKIEFENIDYTDFFNSIISSFPLDADRMDYLYRDSYFSGVKYGLYDLSRLLMSFIPIMQENKAYLAIKESGIDSVIRFIQSRTHLYSQVYFHKTNRAANCMLDYACRKLPKEESIISATTYDEFENFYWENSDELFLWGLLKRKIVTKKEKEVLDELLNRRLWKRVYQKKIVTTPTDKFDTGRKLKDIKEKISVATKKLEDEGIDATVDTFSNEVFKDVKGCKIKIAKKIDSSYRIENNWKTFNKELKILEYEVHIVRIYLRRLFDSPQTFTTQKEKVLLYFKEIIDLLDEIDTPSVEA